MNSIADMVEKMLTGGVPHDMIVLAVRTAEEASRNTSTGISTGIPVENRLEKIRARDRERKRNDANSTGIPPEFHGVHGKALTLKEDNKKEKKVRAAKHPLPAEWKPNLKHFAAAEEMKIPEPAVLSKAEDMRIWAGSTGEKKADWDLTFHGFLRRDAPKLAARARGSPEDLRLRGDAW